MVRNPRWNEGRKRILASAVAFRLFGKRVGQSRTTRDCRRPVNNEGSYQSILVATRESMSNAICIDQIRILELIVVIRATYIISIVYPLYLEAFRVCRGTWRAPALHRRDPCAYEQRPQSPASSFLRRKEIQTWAPSDRTSSGGTPCRQCSNEDRR